MNPRYSRNITTLSLDENESLQHKKVCVIGCGGLGGYVIMELGRLGVGSITAVDGDVFDQSNLNRQLFSDEAVLGQGKAKVTCEKMSVINSLVKVKPIHSLLTAENCDTIIAGHDVVVDALDNLDTRKILQRCCSKLNIPLVHGAIAGWYGQVCTILPSDTIFDIILNNQSKGIETKLGNPSFTPAIVASYQVAETVKLLINRGEILQNKLLMINLLDNEFEIISFD